MQANSRPVSSNQPDIHEALADVVHKHAANPFRRPLTAIAEAAFAHSIARWRSAGELPLILDAGCGVGLSTRRLAAQNPQAFVIGIDQSADRLQRDVRWVGDEPKNFITVRANLVDYWRLMLLHRIYPAQHFLFYPNPWPKKQQLQRRWHGHPVFPTLVALGGWIECRSNWKTYIDEFASALNLLAGTDATTEAFVPEPGAPATPFEEKYAASGHSLWRCRAQLPPLPQATISGLAAAL